MSATRAEYHRDYYQRNKDEAKAKARLNYAEHRERAIQQMRARRNRLTIAEKRLTVLKRYGMTLEDYDAMLTSQGGGCAICGTTEARLVIDHDHDSGVVRGILCCSCNRGIGHFNERLDAMRAAVVYLTQARG